MQREQTEIELREFDQLKPVYTIENCYTTEKLGLDPWKNGTDRLILTVYKDNNLLRFGQKVD